MLYSDKRASSIGFEYMMTFTVALLLLSGATTALEDVTDQQEQQVVVDHFEYIGGEIDTQLQYQYEQKEKHEQTSSMIVTAGGSSPPEFQSTVHVDLPRSVASHSYSVQVSPDGDELVITSSDSLVEHRTPINPEIPVRANSGAPGGEVGITYDASSDEFVIEAIGDLT